MVISKKFYCTFEDFDSVIVALAKEIEDGWHVTTMTSHGISCRAGIRNTEPEFTIELVRKDSCY